MTKLIPVYEYAQQQGISLQTAYRWIRERKIPEENVKKIEKTVTRLMIETQE